MSAQPGRNFLEKNNQLSRSSRSVVEETAFLAEDPEMLRWRADVLMDEMMVGAVDLSANGPAFPDPARTTPVRPTPYAVAQPDDELSTIAKPAPGRNANGVYRRPTAAGENGHYSSSASAALSQENGQAARGYPADPPTYEDVRRAPSAYEPEQPAQEQTVLSAEERYRRLANGQPGQPTATRPPLADSPPTSSWATEQAWQPNGNGAAHSPRPFAERGGEQGASSAVRRASAQFASVMAATAANNRRSTLLPRMSTADVEAMQREIFTLQSEIDNVLPSGHESNQRARRLLEKANAILQQDSLRSAEVEYYLQQVRSIFQRVQQTIHWSGTYRNRLLVYLAAWLGLALIVIVARYLFAAPIQNFVAQVGRFTDDHVVLRHFLTVITALFAGALGGASGALFNLWQQGRQHLGFIDRKYGLRGLILPLMGALVGLLLCLLLLTPLSILNVDLARQPWLAVLPALLAFLFGLTQESIYGTRGA